MRKLITTMTLMTLSLMGCGFDRYIGSCRNETLGMCQDETDSDGNWDPKDAQAICEGQPGGVWSTNACDRTGALGGCHLYTKSAFDLTVDEGTTWIWPGSTYFGTTIRTANDLKQVCLNENVDGTTPSN
jgi:hypothetical protein